MTVGLGGWLVKHLRHQSHEKEVYEGHSGLMLGSLWAYGGTFGSLWATLGLLWTHFKVTLGAFGGHCGRMEVASEHVGVALGAF